VRRVKAVSLPVLNNCPYRAYFLIFLRTKRTSLNNFKRWARRVEAEWVAVPLVTGDVAVLATAMPGGAAVEDCGAAVEDAEPLLDLMLRQHDRSRVLTASAGIRLTTRQSPTTDVMWATTLTIEEYAARLERMGLTVEWSGVGWFSVRGLTTIQVDQLKAMAA
jgi:hypothetical protein